MSEFEHGENANKDSMLTPELLTALENLPDSLKVVLQLTDLATVLKLTEAYGGLPLHFPPLCRVHKEHKLAKLVGLDNLNKLCRYYDGDTIYLPKAKQYLQALRDQQILQDCQYMNNIEVAKKHGISERWVREIKSRGVVFKPAKEDKQLTIF